MPLCLPSGGAHDFMWPQGALCCQHNHLHLDPGGGIHLVSIGGQWGNSKRPLEDERLACDYVKIFMRYGDLRESVN